MTSATANPVLADDLDLAREATRDRLRIVVVGSVDDGKSTLIGRLLYETGSLPEDQITQVRAATRRGEDIDFSYFTDGLRAEREQGITIDVAYRHLSTSRRRFLLADTPGHVQYTRNMATGASTADLAVILLDARLGVLPQSRRHAYLASLLGIRHLAVVVNKMDLVGFDEAIFARLSSELGELAGKLGFQCVRSFPVSASDGDNVVTESARTPWFHGGTLLAYFEEAQVARGHEAGPFRYPVQTVIRPRLDHRAFAGQVAAGSIAVGEEVVVLPSGVRSRISAIDTFEGALPRAFAPMSVALRLADEVDIGRGDLVARPEELPVVARELEADVVWLAPTPLDPSREYLVKHTTRLVPARVTAVRHRIDLERLDADPTPTLALNDVGRLALRLSRPILCDPYRQVRATGAFILIDALTNETAGAGMIVAATEEAAPRSTLGSLVTAAERRARFGHAAAILAVEAPEAGVALDAARALERSLFDAGIAAALAAPEDALALANAGLMCVVASSGSETERAALRDRLGAKSVPAGDGALEAAMRATEPVHG